MFKVILCILSICLTTIGCSLPKYYQTSGLKNYELSSQRVDKVWKLVWKDDFSGKHIDTNYWSRIDKGTPDWNKHMSLGDSLVRMENGILYLRGVRNLDTLRDARPFLTGGIWSKGKFSFQYGRIEIRAKLGMAQGAWPAIWMLAEEERYGPYPKNGEIDIMEHLNFEDKIYQTTHSYYTLDLKQTENPPHGATTPVKADDYNIYAVSWYPDRLVFQLNGKDTFTYPRVKGVDASQWPYDQPFYLIIDQQLGGNWVGPVNLDHLPVEMAIDWVKLYQ